MDIVGVHMIHNACCLCFYYVMFIIFISESEIEVISYPGGIMLFFLVVIYCGTASLELCLLEKRNSFLSFNVGMFKFY